MSENSHIAWTQNTWNPVTGCDQVSEGCDHCYAKAIAGRWWAKQYPPNEDGSPRTFEDVRLHPDRLEQPFRWKKPSYVFVNSMSDLFHDDVPSSFIAAVFDVMRRTPQHTYQILTKRPGRMASLSRGATFGEGWPLPNVWLGTSVENQRWANVRVPQLLKARASVRFLSCEPLLGPLTLSEGYRTMFLPPVLYGTSGESVASTACEEGSLGRTYYDAFAPYVDWVIVGGESGPGHRPMDLAWARSLRDQCVKAGVPFFYKQGSGPRPEMDRKLDGRTWEEMPRVA